MTIKERAENLVTAMDCDSCQRDSNMRKQMTLIVADEIRAAVDEAYDDAVRQMDFICKDPVCESSEQCYHMKAIIDRKNKKET